MARIGLVAGYGELPILFADAAKAKGDTVIAFGLKGLTSDELAKHVEKIHWLEWGGLKKGLMLLALERIGQIALLGKIKKEVFLKNDDRLDDEAKKLLGNNKDKKDYALLGEVAKLLQSVGVKIIDLTAYLGDLIPSKGTLTKRSPTESEWEDVRYGENIARELARLDIGQAVAVRDKTVISVEAIEGTDEAIRRAGALAKQGFVVVKMARPEQDMRFDVPLIGLDTLKSVVETGAKVLAFEEKKTLLMNREEMIRLADENGVAIVVI